MKFLLISLLLFVLAVGFTAATNTMPEAVHNFYDFPYGDKVIHFLLIGGANGAVLLLLSNWWRRSSSLIAAVTVFSLLLATIDEFAQKLFPHRTFSLQDLFANYSGIIFFAFIAFILIRKSDESNKEIPVS